MELLYLLTIVVLAQTSYLTYNNLKPSRKKLKAGIICDTSILIDGRIVSIARSGFVNTDLIVPRSVLHELQYMADRADHEKRERARFGLDNVQTLQSIDYVSVVIYDDGKVGEGGVDEQLLILAKKFGARLCTTDYNLNKVARVESVQVININELAHALRPQHLPGERSRLEIVQPGQNKDQGVGYFDDGTMVVVDNARKLLGTRVEVEAVRMLQTEAGRMLFAKLVSPSANTSVQEKPANERPTARKPRNSTQQRFRRKTPEDSMIELANKE